MNNTKAISDATTAGRIFNVSRWTLEAGYNDWYNALLAWTNPEVAGLVPLVADRELGSYVWHLAGLA